MTQKSDRVSFLMGFPDEAVETYKPYLDADPDTFYFGDGSDASRALTLAIEHDTRCRENGGLDYPVSDDSVLGDWLAEEVVLQAFAAGHLDILTMLNDGGGDE